MLIFVSVKELAFFLFNAFISLQCSDTVGWATGRASGLYNAGCWFAGGDDLTGVLHDFQLSSPTASPLAPIKSRVQTFWYQLVPRFTWKMVIKM